MKTLFLSSICFFTSLILVSQQVTSNKKPNILFIAIDDLKPTIGAFNDDFAITPNIDKVAKNSAVFLNNHTQQAICAPSRVSLLTGKRPDYTGVWDLETQMRDVRPDIISIPQHFKNNGYETIGLGKIFDPRSVDKEKDKLSWSKFIQEGTFKYADGYKRPQLGFYQDKDILKKIESLKEEASKKGIKEIDNYVRGLYKPPFESPNVPDDAYIDGAMANEAINVLDNVDDDKPFFLAIGFIRPHLPFNAPKKYWDLYDKSKIKLASYQKKSENAVDIAYHKSNELQSYKDPNISYDLNNEDLLGLKPELQTNLIHGYYAATSYIDAQIGKIIEKLKSANLYENTIIVIWGDHGWHLGDHSLWNKHSNFEQATRSPLIIYNPKINKGYNVETVTEFVDIFPTLCEISNIETPENLDGISLAPQINGEQNTSKLFAVSQYPRGKNMGYSFRAQNYRYTVWIKNKKSTEPIYKEDIIGEELYDYKIDPNETNNRINDEAYLSRKTSFQTMAARYFKSQIILDNPISIQSQNTNTNKNKFALNRATIIADHIASIMKLKSDEISALKEILYEKYNTNAQKTNGANLTKEEKQEVYKQTFANSRLALLKVFSNKQLLQINQLEREKQKELRENK